MINQYLNFLFEDATEHEYKKLGFDGRGGGNVKSFKGWKVTPERQKKYKKKFIDNYKSEINTAMTKFNKSNKV